MKRRGGRRLRDGGGFAMIAVVLVLILTGPMLYLGCGQSSGPPPERPREKAAPPAAEEQLKQEMARPPQQQLARMAAEQKDKEGSQQIVTRGGHVKFAQDDQAQVIERLLEKMQLGNIAFNVPSAMNLHKTAMIQLVLSLQKPIDELKQMIEAEGEKQGTSVKVSNIMVARLKGTHFQIDAINPESQVVTPSEVTEWKWEVKPTSTGPQALHLTLSAQLTVEGQPTSKLVRTFDKTIEVNVTLAQQATDFLGKFGQWLWAAVVIPLGGWFWRRRKAAQAKKAPDENTPGQA
jgi:hypothetical protein